LIGLVRPASQQHIAAGKKLAAMYLLIFDQNLQFEVIDDEYTPRT